MTANRTMIIAVFCQGTPRVPEKDPGLIALEHHLIRYCGKWPEMNIRILLFGPYTLDPKMSEAEALYRCMTNHKNAYFVANCQTISIEKIENSYRLRQHVVRLYELRRPGERIVIVCESVVVNQVLAQLNRYFPDRDRAGHRVEIEDTAFNPGAHAWLNLWVKQPAREWADYLYDEWPGAFSVVDRLLRWINVRLAGLTER